MRIYNIASDKYQSYRSAGPAYVSRRLLQITSLLMPLRRTCSGGSLSQRDMTVNPRAAASSVQHTSCVRGSARNAHGLAGCA